MRPVLVLLSLTALVLGACGGGEGSDPSEQPTPDASSPDAGGSDAEEDAGESDPQCEGQPQLTPCDDGNACTKDDACLDGQCLGGVDCDDGELCTDDECVGTECVHSFNTQICDDGDECTSPDACSEGVCVGKKLSGIECDDGEVCTVDDTCDNGECKGDANKCNDLNNCTQDLCDGAHPDAEPGTGCVHVPLTDQLCNDTNPCTVDDTCVDGACVGVTKGGAPCQTGDLCTENGVCQDDGSCLGEPTVVCDDDNICTTDSCDPDKGCVFTPLPGDPCDDGVNCTIEDQCLKDGSCSGAPKPCQPDDACIIGSCVEETGACVEVDVDCGDNNPCTDDSCDSALGCVNTNNTLPCNDGSVCTTGDHCDGGDCVGASEVECDDSDDTECAKNVCDPVSGECVMDEDTGSTCDDGDACTTNDKCASGVCSGVSKNCDDNDPCTLDLCDSGSGDCDHQESPDGCGGIAIERANEYRLALGMPLIDHEPSIENAAQAHCDYYVNNYAEVYSGPGAISPHSEAPGYEGYTGTAPWDRMAAAGYQSPGISSEVMAFIRDPKGAVDAWVSTVYHRIPFVVPLYNDAGYGMAQKGLTKCDTMDFGGGANPSAGAEGKIYPFPLDGMANVPTMWDGLESPQPPLPPGKTYPSGPILTVTFGANAPWSTANVTGSELVDDLGAPVPHSAWDEFNDSNLCCGVVSMYADSPLEPYTTYTATIDYSFKGKSGSITWSFTTGDGTSLAFDP